MAEAQAEIADWLREVGLAEPREAPQVTTLSGGVSSDVYRVDLARGPVCVKRALPRLKVAADWKAPVERSANEAAWLRVVGDLDQPVTPKVLAEDRDRHLFAMTWFAPEDYPVWKSELARGRIDPAFAAHVGAALGNVHAHTARSEALANAFATDALFVSLRIEPYLTHTACVHPALADPIGRVARNTLACRRALVHGDVSPKNILVGPAGPVFLDAECAWYGDPAFDLAFCANHLLLKAVWLPQHAPALRMAFEALVTAYLERVEWEAADELESRAAPLLAALMLARIDGKSPVEYLTEEADKVRVRAIAGTLLLRERLTLAAVAAAVHDGPGSP